MGALASCASRSLEITSEPAGAEVLIAGREVGTTPLSLPFVHGGERELLFLLPGHEPLLLVHDSENVWLDTPFLDGLASLAGTEDRPTLHVTLVQSSLGARLQDDETSTLEALRFRAERLAAEARARELEAPPAPTGSTGPGVIGGRILPRR